MISFDFTKSYIEVKEEILSPYREKVIYTINKIKSGENEYIFSALLDSDNHIKRLKKIVNFIKKNFYTLIVVGIGGSSLGARTLVNGLNPGLKNACGIYFLENVDPEPIIRAVEKINPAETGVIFISRSGTTLETVSQYLVLKEYFRTKLKNKFAKNFFIVTAEENSFLGKEARKFKYTLIKLPRELVGRYSVLSPVGLVPAGAGGLDIDKILEGAREIRKICLSKDLTKNPAVQFAVACYHHYLRGRKTIVIMPYRDALFSLGEWFAQLWAESLGKVDSDGTPQGQTPLRGIGTQDQHSLLQLYLDGPDDKIVVFVTSTLGRDIIIQDSPEEFYYLRNKNLSAVLTAEQKATQDALFAKGRPSICIRLDKLDESSLGGLFYFFETATLFMASFLKVNPFDQPAVEEIKRRAKDLLLS
jgi:glucose-6-phosphate isomerase